MAAQAFTALIAGCSEPAEVVERHGCVGGIQARDIIAAGAAHRCPDKPGEPDAAPA